ncbi:hypothetical protein COO60DRAFT_1508812 [Scenedesmus sp. NREL 46B-D3]|nr:hypothetical protein COO60DRAFT_1508812 [Scenedesmus sp. NREL 46B-D3]
MPLLHQAAAAFGSGMRWRPVTSSSRAILPVFCKPAAAARLAGPRCTNGCMVFPLVPQNRQHGAPTPGLAAAAAAGPASSRRYTATQAAASAAAPLPATAAVDLWHTLAVLATCAAASQLVEAHTRWGALLSAPLLALMAALAATSVGLLPPASPVYDAVWRFLMPLGVALYLLENDITSLATSGRQVLAAFLLGAGTMLAGAWVSWQLVGPAMGPAGPQLASCLLASYIGGSVNFAAVASATQLPAALVPPAMAADNLAMLALLAAMMAAPLRRITAALRPALATAAAATGPPPPPAAAGPRPAHSALPVAARSSPHDRSPGAGRPAVVVSGNKGLDGHSLETQPPSAEAVAACMEDSARGCAAPRGRSSRDSSSSSSSSSSGVRKMQGGPKQHVRSRGFGQLSLDGGPLLTPDPIASNGIGTAAAAAAAGTAEDSSSDSSIGNGRHDGRACGGCRASGVTAFDDNPLLTQAPAMGDAISTISAAREGRQKVIRPQQLPGSRGGSRGNSGSSSPRGSYSNSRTPYVSSSSDVVGCGSCSEALDSMAAASSTCAASTITPAAAAAAADPRPSGALALDGGALFTEEPETGRMAAAVAAARQGSRSGSVSVSNSALSSLASVDSTDELELLVKFNKAELEESLKQQLEQYQEKQQQQQQQHSSSSSSSSSKVSPMVSRIDSRSRSSVDAGSSSVLTSSSAAAALAAAAVACAASEQLAVWLSAPALQLLLLSCCALGLSIAGSAVHKLLCKETVATPASKSKHTAAAAAAAAAAVAAGPFAGASQLGQLLMGLFFATLGASCCCSWSSLGATAPLMGFVGVMVAVHWALLVLLGSGMLPGMRRMRLPVEVLLAGSAANIGGPATAAGLAAARGWDRLVQPSLLCGSLGYALGTAGGLLLARGLGVV